MCGVIWEHYKTSRESNAASQRALPHTERERERDSNKTTSDSIFCDDIVLICRESFLYFSNLLWTQFFGIKLSVVISILL